MMDVTEKLFQNFESRYHEKKCVEFVSVGRVFAFCNCNDMRLIPVPEFKFSGFYFLFQSSLPPEDVHKTVHWKM